MPAGLAAAPGRAPAASIGQPGDTRPCPSVGNKELTTLLRTLQRFGVTRYQTPELTLEFGRAPEAPARAIPAPRPGEEAFAGPAVGEAGFELPDLTPEDGDPATLMMDLAERNFPKEALRRPTRVVGPEAVGGS